MDMILRIRDLREDRDLKQREIAKLLLCDQSLYSKYERGEREMPLHLVVRLAEFYGVSVDYLVSPRRIPGGGLPGEYLDCTAGSAVSAPVPVLR